MKTSCLILSALVLVSIMAICVMVKFATDITVDSEKRLSDYDPPTNVVSVSRGMGVISLSDTSSVDNADRFPYLGAVTRNSSSSWTFACFSSVILIKWIVTSAHCRLPGSVHRLLLYQDVIRNKTHTYPILFWRVHEDYNASSMSPRFDIAVAKLNLDTHPFTIKSSTFDELPPVSIQASVWKTLTTMDRKIYLTNDLENYNVHYVPVSYCYESYGVFLDASMFCVDMSGHDDCFVQDFGPIYSKDKVVGILAAKPKECDMKLAIFTNVSFYTDWILKTTKTTWYG